jgi:DNA-directed RNA polymerase sigma subunit (sigma70/sigma32)
VFRFGLDLEGGVYRTLQTVGDMIGGVTRERARQLEERALGALGILED